MSLQTYKDNYPSYEFPLLMIVPLVTECSVPFSFFFLFFSLSLFVIVSYVLFSLLLYVCLYSLRIRSYSSIKKFHIVPFYGNVMSSLKLRDRKREILFFAPKLEARKDNTWLPESFYSKIRKKIMII